MSANNSLLSIQKMTGGGRPAGGRHCNTSETPFCTTTASFLSFDHKGDPECHKIGKERRRISPIVHRVCIKDPFFEFLLDCLMTILLETAVPWSLWAVHW